MRPRPFRRFAAALVNLFFLLAWGEPVALCPAHDPLAVEVMAAAQHHVAAAAGAGADVAGGHDMAMPGAAGGHGQAGGHTCHCMGQCSVAVGIVAPTAQAIRWQVVTRRQAEPDHAEPAAPRAAAPRLLPFSNGPPRTA